MRRSIAQARYTSAAVLAALASPMILDHSAKALTETFTTTTPIGLTPVVWNQNLAFAKFDPSLGVLTGASFSLSIPASGSANVSNQTSATQSFGGSITDPLVLKDPALNILDSTEGEVDFFYTVAANSTYQSGTVTGSDVTTFSLNATERTEFTGTGSINVDASAGPASVTTGSGVSGSEDSFSLGLTGSVTYTYTAPVPEPASMSLLGFAGLGLLRRRRRTAGRSN